MNLRPEEISSVIKEEIKKYSTEFEVANVGTVIHVRWHSDVENGKNILLPATVPSAFSAMQRV